MTSPVILINSGAYILQELSAEFGPLPPAFLPVGMRRLYELQVEALAPVGGEMYLTLPESFRLPAWDAERLAGLGVQVIASPDSLELGGALLFALGRMGFVDRPLRILHGDTLISGLDPSAEDAVAAAAGADGYRWAKVEHEDGRVARISRPELVTESADSLRLTGYFAFTNSARFAEALALARGDFFDALNSYAETSGLRLTRTGRWLDFGHVQTFFRSRREITTQRAFNSLEIDGVTVRKRSRESAKLRAEASWLLSIPAPLRPFSARLLQEGEDGVGYFYDTEYEYMPTLAELYVFGRLAPGSWKRILGSCQDFLDTAAQVEPPSLEDRLAALAIEKTRGRLRQYAIAHDLDLEAPNTLNGRPAPSFATVLKSIEAQVRADASRPAVMHGDFCFSNILFDARTDRIRVIDPRGVDAQGRPTLFGDTRYDVAKLMHSIRGRYDLIIAGQVAAGKLGPNAFTLEFPEEEGRRWVESAASEMQMGGVALDSDAVSATVVSLFLSMPPLHADRPERQTAFLANALRLYLDLESARP